MPPPTIQPQRRSLSDCEGDGTEASGIELLVDERRAALDEHQRLAGRAERIAEPRRDAADDVSLGAEADDAEGLSVGPLVPSMSAQEAWPSMPNTQRSRCQRLQPT